jgi:hypothetical protein
MVLNEACPNARERYCKQNCRHGGLGFKLRKILFSRIGLDRI